MKERIEKELDRLELQVQELYKKMTKDLVKLQREIEVAKILLDVEVGK